MAACNKDNGIRPAEERREAMAERGSTPAGRVTFHIFKGQDARTKEQRRADLDAEARSLGVSAMCFV